MFVPQIPFCCEPYVGQSKGYGVHSTTSGRDAFEGGRQVSPLCQHLGGIDKGQLDITGCQRPSDSLCRETCIGEEAKSAFLPFRAVSSDTGEVSSLVEKGAVTVADSHSPQAEFYSVLFLVPKKNGQMRLVINLKALNQWVQTPYFKMEGLTSLRDLLRLHRGGSRLPIHLPSFGLACAPWAFTKIMKAVVTLLRSWGIRIIIYIDDILIMSKSTVLAAQHLRVLTHILQCLGFIINTKKSNTENRIPGHDGEYQYPAGQSPSRQGETDQGRNHQNFQHGLSVSPSALPLSGEAQCSNPDYSTSPSILPLPAKGPTGSSNQQQPGLQGVTRAR